MAWILPVTKCAPWSKNDRPRLKLMLMSRLPMGISFFCVSSVLVLLNSATIGFRRPLCSASVGPPNPEEDDGNHDPRGADK